MLAEDHRELDRTRTRYVVLQTEIGANDTRHLQGYVEMRNPRSLNTIRRMYTPTADANDLPRLHIERRRGTQAQAIAYCKKSDTRIRDNQSVEGENGTAKKLGADTIAVVAAAIKQGEELQTLAEDYPTSFIKNGAGIRSWTLNRKGRRTQPPEIIIYYGPTGTGKTSLAYENWPGAYAVPLPEKGGWWWHMYMGEDTVILDDFNGAHCKYSTLLSLLDRFPFTIQEKGSNSNFISHRIVFTTNHHPTEWYTNIPYADKAPLRRRLRDFATLFIFDDVSTYEERIYSEETGFALEDPNRT